MFAYPLETETPQPLYVISIGSTAAEIVDDSHVVEDYPRYFGRSQVASLRVDTNKATTDGRIDGMLTGVPDAQDVRHTALARFMRDDATYIASQNGTDDSVPQGFLAAAKEYDALYSRVTRDVTRLAASHPTGGGPLTVAVAVVAWIGRGSGAGGLPVLLQILQRARRQLAYTVDLQRSVLLTLPCLWQHPKQNLERWTHAAAVLATLGAAQRHGLEVAPLRKLMDGAPLAEWILVHDRARMEAPFDYQRRDASAALRLVCDPGRLGKKFRGELQGMGTPDLKLTDPRIFRSLGTSTMIYDREHLADFLATVLLAEADKQRENAPVGAF